MRQIKTYGNTINLQQRNKLKGTAMQKLILQTMPNNKEDISMKKILEVITKQKGSMVIVNKPFKINNKLKYNDHDFILTNEFIEPVSVQAPMIKNEAIWKRCDNENCRQYIPAWTKETTRACRKCNQGWFKPVERKSVFYEEKYEGNKKGAIEWLFKNKFLQKLPQLRRRADFFYIKEDTFYILESKNKEDTGLRFSDIKSALMYPLILKESGYKFSNILLIYNGIGMGEELMQKLQSNYSKRYYLTLKFIHILDYLDEKGVNNKSVLIRKIKGKYVYSLLHQQEPSITIDIGIGEEE